MRKNDFATMFLRVNKRPVVAGSCAQTAPGDNGSYNNSYQSPGHVINIRRFLSFRYLTS